MPEYKMIFDGGSKAIGSQFIDARNQSWPQVGLDQLLGLKLTQLPHPIFPGMVTYKEMIE